MASLAACASASVTWPSAWARQSRRATSSSARLWGAASAAFTNWSASMGLRSETRRERTAFRQNASVGPNEGLAWLSIFGEDGGCQTLIFPRFAGTPAPPSAGSSCFWGFVLRTRAPNQRPFVVAATLPLGSVGFEREATEAGERLIWTVARIRTKSSHMGSFGGLTPRLLALRQRERQRRGHQ
jgi:hypothetical protein